MVETPKNHTQDDACDSRHCQLATMAVSLEIQGRLLWAILAVLIGGLIKIFFGGQ